MSSFEEAKHQGYSASEMAQDMAEREQRAKDLGCFKCKWGEFRSPTCDLINESSRILCPYFKDKEA